MRTIPNCSVDAGPAPSSACRTTRHLICWLFIAISTLSTTAFAAEVRLGVIMDIPRTESSLAFVETLTAEVEKTLGASNELRLDPTDILSTDWDGTRARSHYNALSSRCDVIVLLGSGAIHEVASVGNFVRPTLGLGVFDAKLQGIPYEDNGVSGTKNFSYVLTSRDLANELSVFQQIAPFKNLTLLFDRRFAPHTSGSGNLTDALGAQLGASVQVSLLTEDIDASLAAIPTPTDAVYLWAPYGLATADLERIAAVLVERRLPSFAANRAGVDAGLMGGLIVDNAVDQALRKLAIMIDEVVRGEDLATMPVAISYSEELYLNGGTMHAIDVSPPFELLFAANVVEPLVPKGPTTHNLHSLIESALTENLDLKISKIDVSLANQEHRTARSQYLPSIDLSSSYTAVNEEQTSPLTGQAERTISGSVQLQQLIFSESATANIRIQSYLRDAEAATEDQVALDLILAVFDSYFDVLRIKTNVAIRTENLTTSRKNLELARVRVGLGASNRADIFRWESEVASATQSVIEVNLQLAVAKQVLDDLLNGTLGDAFGIEDESIDGELYRILSGSLIADQLIGPGEFGQLLEFLTEEMRRRNPSKLQLESIILATERQHQLNRHRFYTPTLSANASLNSVLDRSGAGSVPLAGASFTDESWRVALSLTFPIFEGNRRRIDLETTQLQRQQLEYQRDDLDQRLSLAVLSAATNLLTAHTNIRFSRISADNTKKNFDLLQDNYRQGVVSLLDVLDAQNAALQAKQSYAVSVYNYMTELMALENLLGEYSLLATPEGNRSLRQRFETFVIQQEGQP